MKEPENINEFKQILEAALLTADQPLSLDDMLKLFAGRMERTTLRMLLDEIKQDWFEKTLELAQVATGYRFQARVQFSEFIARLNPERQSKYSRAVMETLAIIAYRQPVTRGDIEEIRGVAVSSQILKTLEVRGWIEAIGTRDTPGKPELFATTKQLLDDLNLRSLQELPSLEEIGSLLEHGEQTAA